MNWLIYRVNEIYQTGLTLCRPGHTTEMGLAGAGRGKKVRSVRLSVRHAILSPGSRHRVGLVGADGGETKLGLSLRPSVTLSPPRLLLRF